MRFFEVIARPKKSWTNVSPGVSEICMFYIVQLIKTIGSLFQGVQEVQEN